MNPDLIETNIRDLEGILKWRPDLTADMRKAIAESVRLLAESLARERSALEQSNDR